MSNKYRFLIFTDNSVTEQFIEDYDKYSVFEEKIYTFFIKNKIVLSFGVMA